MLADGYLLDIGRKLIVIEKYCEVIKNTENAPTTTRRSQPVRNTVTTAQSIQTFGAAILMQGKPSLSDKYSSGAMFVDSDPYLEQAKQSGLSSDCQSHLRTLTPIGIEAQIRSGTFYNSTHFNEYDRSLLRSVLSHYAVLEAQI